MLAATIAGILIILLVLWDAFETVVLPRRVTRRFRLTGIFYRQTWRPWRASARFSRGRGRETFLSLYGPLSLIALLAVWAAGLVLGFACVQWSLASPLNVGSAGFGTYLYVSGTTFFTLGLGDVTPTHALGRALAVLESGTGFGFLALVLGYLPVLYQAFSRREVNISMLDARAGSPPTAGELLRRQSGDDGAERLREFLHDWERWSAELMESHLSYPVLAYFRSQHDNQSWLGSLTAVVDASALVMSAWEGPTRRQAELTFAISRHALVDLSQVFHAAPTPPAEDRLPAADWVRLHALLGAARCDVSDHSVCFQELSRLRAMYEPYANALAHHLGVTLPPWLPPEKQSDNWQTTAWERGTVTRFPADPRN